MATTTATRGYVAINLSLAPQTDKIEMTAREELTIEGTNGAVVTIKAGEKFTAVRAGSLGDNMFYIVRDVVGEKKCTCPSAKPCVHEVHVSTGKPLSELRAEVAARAEARKQARKSRVACKVAEAKELATTGTVVNETASKFSSEPVEQMMARVAAPASFHKVTLVAEKQDIGVLGTLNGQPQTSQMPAWLAILPSRREAIA